MQDITKIDKPFGLLDEETQSLLRTYAEAGGHMECYSSRGLWEYAVAPFFDNGVYRAKPTDTETEPQPKPKETRFTIEFYDGVTWVIDSPKDIDPIEFAVSFSRVLEKDDIISIRDKNGKTNAFRAKDVMRFTITGGEV